MNEFDAFARWTLMPSAVVAVCAASVLVWAWTSGRVGDHPYCRRCGFDLFGRTLLAKPACPECGAALARRRAVVVGKRAVRPQASKVATAVLFMSLGGMALSWWSRVGAAAWARHKPIDWVLRDTESASPQTRDPALAELARRLQASEIPPAQETVLIERALKYQADWKRPWAPGWGALVESGWAVGKVTRAQWQRYQTHSVTFTFTPRVSLRVMREGLISFDLRRGPDRLSDRSPYAFTIGAYAETGITFADIPLTPLVEVTDSRSQSRTPLVPNIKGVQHLATIQLPARDRPAGGEILAQTKAFSPGELASLQGLPEGNYDARLAIHLHPFRLIEGNYREPRRFEAEPGSRVEAVSVVTLTGQPTAPEDANPSSGRAWRGVGIPPVIREEDVRAVLNRPSTQRPTVTPP